MDDWVLASPGGAVAIQVRLGVDGVLDYRVVHRNRPVVGWSRLGVVRTDQVFDAPLTLIAAGEQTTVQDRYTMMHGKQRDGRADGRARSLLFANAAGAELAVDLRAYDDGVAFRYRFPGVGDMTLVRELTEVTPAEDGEAWLQPTQEPLEYGPAYEAPYGGVPIGTASSGPGWDLPAAFHTGNSWLLVAESGLDATCFGSRLAPVPHARTYSFAPPLAGEGDGHGSAEARSSLPWTLPWRAIVVADRPGGLVESQLVDHLAEPSRIPDPSWVQPGRVSWSWWSDNDSPRDLRRLRDFVDLAHDFGWEYSLVDANWTVHTDDDMRELVRYAADRDVRLFLWYNSGGPHNHVTEQPRDRMHDRTVRRAELAKIAQWGVAGIKVDFFHSDKQDGIARYLDILADAAEHRIMVNFHGCTIPRGWTRTWPHLMTMEGVRGAETYIFDEQFPAVAPRHNTILPFTRNAVGPMDYTPVTFSDNRYPHQTTPGHELALAVVFESGLLHFADSDRSYRSLPPEAAGVLSRVPAAWDETRCLTGVPGSHVVIARRRGDDWFVAGINGRSEPVAVDLDVAELTDPDTAWLVLSDASRGEDLTATSATAERAMSLVMAPYGGFLATTSRG
ncbi:glycoside hydrolase family 97 catalytic domain-containing protein [Actinoplanes sp. NPDC051633]|uniref:glycoside hydrolase family 97 protein n=1 Tax=Actinoplanes sp. NPDC051633 TaxID=3155670 RepID=UPI00341CF2F6